MHTKCSFISLAVFLLFGTALGINDVQKVMIQSKFLAGGMQCLKDHPLSAEEIKTFRSKMMPEGKEAQCFAACLFKKLGVMDDMGKLSQMGAVESAKQIFTDEDHVKKVGEFVEKCSTVNMQNVTDGEMGCDRAKMAFTCLAENAPKFGFNINF